MIEEFTELFNLNLPVAIGMVFFIVFGMNVLKKYLNIKGKQCTWVVLIFCGACAILAALHGAWKAIETWHEPGTLGLYFAVSFIMNFVGYGIINVIGAMGGWETFKLGMHKAAEPKKKE